MRFIYIVDTWIHGRCNGATSSSPLHNCSTSLLHIRTGLLAPVQQLAAATNTASSVVSDGAPATGPATHSSLIISTPSPNSNVECEDTHPAMAVDDSLLLMDRSSVSSTSSCHELSDGEDDGVIAAESRGSDGSQGSLASRGSQEEGDCANGAAETSRERRDSGVGSSLTREPR